MSDTPKRILVIDDDPDIQAVLEVVLEDLGGYLVAACQSGPEALVEAPGFAPDLILLDMMMPDIDGLMTLRGLRALPGLAQTPVIFLTAQTTDPAALMQLPGVIGVIAKPFHHRDLVEQLRRFWAEPGSPTQQQVLPGDLQRLREEYLASAKRRYELMAALWEQRSASALEQLQRQAHQLAGSGAALGFAAISAIATALEVAVVAGDLNLAQLAHIDQLMARLDQAIHTPQPAPASWPDDSAHG